MREFVVSFEGFCIVDAENEEEAEEIVGAGYPINYSEWQITDVKEDF